VSAPPAGPVDRIRGLVTGLLTAALAVAAHGAGGGALPNGATIALLAVVAATAGAVAAIHLRARSPRYLVALLAVGQLLGHVLLSAAGHHHTGPAAPPGVAMFAAHLLAIVAGATLIGAGERLWRALSRTVLSVVRVAHAVAATPAPAPRRADQPLRSALQLAASMSHRGPPIGLAS
jgi:hypothetical protein